jgi:hypothetical protein
MKALVNLLQTTSASVAKNEQPTTSVSTKEIVAKFNDIVDLLYRTLLHIHEIFGRYPSTAVESGIDDQHTSSISLLKCVLSCVEVASRSSWPGERQHVNQQQQSPGAQQRRSNATMDEWLLSSLSSISSKNFASVLWSDVTNSELKDATMQWINNARTEIL